ncbi:MAG TPA: orotate phosphoribosyltransferase [Planctomycetota bacterium]|nr:orotate phosphoribosyltransferase [Planctomycetota bacterium]HJM38749.1 orotate phosphoribosyltransferase [Planctomycetota bacterium]
MNPVAEDSGVADRLLQSLRESEALLEGHFLLSSGRHAGRYVQCAKLLQYPELAAQACQDLAEQAREVCQNEQPFDVVVGPAMGAVTMGFELARAMGVRGIFSERSPEGGFTLRRGFEINPGERVLVAEDVVTTGKSVKEVLLMLQDMGAGETAVASLVNRSGSDNPFGDNHRYFRLADLEVPSWEAEDCPLCVDDSVGPAIKPGSRPGLS